MTTQTDKPEEGGPDPVEIDQVRQTAHAEGFAAATTRAAAILTCEHASTRMAMAVTLATGPMAAKTTAEEAIQLLADAPATPVANAVTVASALDSALAGSDVGVNDVQGEDSLSEADEIEAMAKGILNVGMQTTNTTGTVQ